jgi:hypothetical protein
MLKLTISVNKNLNISKFERLKMFIERKNNGYQVRKLQVFSRHAVVNFLLDAPNIEKAPSNISGSYTNCVYSGLGVDRKILLFS